MNDISIIAKVNKNFAFADYHTDALYRVETGNLSSLYSLIQEIKIKNNSTSSYESLQMKIKFNVPFLKIDDIFIASINPYSEITLFIPIISVDYDNYINLNESIPCDLTLSLIENDNVIAESNYLFNILPIMQPSDNLYLDYRLYAKYVTPNASIVKNATLDLNKDYNTPIITYLNHDFKTFLAEIKRVYEYFHYANITYQVPPAGTVPANFDNHVFVQRLRLADEVLTTHKGTCLDNSLLFCSLLQELGFHPILVLLKTHALVGIFSDEKLHFTDGILTNQYELYNLATTEKIILVDIVCGCANYNFSFTEAMAEGMKHINDFNEELYAIDIDKCHQSFFAPLPTIKEDYNFQANIQALKLKESEEKRILNVKYIDLEQNQEKKDRFSIWEKKLLDLTEANPLVNFHFRETNTVRIVSKKPIAEMLDGSNIYFETIDNKFPHVVKEEVKSFIQDEKKNDELNFLIKAIDYEGVIGVGLNKNLKKIKAKSDLALEETGAPTLYLSLGVIHYPRRKREIRDLNHLGTAPFMVLPVKLIKEKMGNRFHLEYDLDDLMINQTFFEYYRLEHPGVDFSALYKIDSDYSYFDYVATFKKHAHMDLKLDENIVFLANLSFSHYIMWLDMHKRRDELKKNLIVKSIIKNESLLQEDLTSTKDDTIDYMSFVAPLAYDSTQLRAILAGSKGRSFILNGPPGTGKSQTIVNMIVNAFYNGKTVLFVAEKKAALDVVYDRLDKLKLSRFCLELHSNKASKQAFFTKLATIMAEGSSLANPLFTEKSLTLNYKKEALAEKMAKMHQRKYVKSLYEAICKEEECCYLDNDFDASEIIASYSKEDYEKGKNFIAEFTRLSSAIKNFDSTPLKLLRLTNFNFTDCAKALSIVKEYQALYLELKQVYYAICQKFKMRYLLNDQILNDVMALLDARFSCEIASEHLAYYATNDQNKDLKTFDVARKTLALQKELEASLEVSSLLNLKIETLNDELSLKHFFIRDFWINHKAKKMLKPFFKVKLKGGRSKLRLLYQKIFDYQKYYHYLIDEDEGIIQALGIKISENLDDLNHLQEVYQNTQNYVLNALKIKPHLLDSNTLFTIQFDDDLHLLYQKITPLYAKLKETNCRFVEMFSPEYSLLNEAENAVNFDLLLDYLLVDGNYEYLMQMTRLNQLILSCDDLIIKYLIKQLLISKEKVKHFDDLYEYIISLAVIKLSFNDSDINFFNGLEYNSQLQAYRNLLNEFKNIGIEEVYAKLTAGLNHENIKYAASSPIGILKKHIANNGRKTTIREVLLNYDDIIRAYFPCFLMSPLSAAQYLSVSDNMKKFDIVIFDEASQIPTYEAIGPIARGNSLIVSGDPKQMPPANYFGANIDYAQDEASLQDATSLLDECIAIGMPNYQLSYHYRSRHESLIAFSNQKFYNNSLLVFPSPKEVKSMIHFKNIPIDVTKKNSGLSDVEIKEIISTINNIMSLEKNKAKSLGVIVFNMNQREILADYFNDYLDTHKDLKAKLDEAAEITREPFFIKSLENVQGDERDIIILSINFNKSSYGYPLINGPLTIDNGERRLNVAVSRSKEEMYVLSTIKASDFPLIINAKGQGPKMLRDFLDYAENCGFRRINKNENPNYIASLIANDLKEYGYETDLNIGISGFVIDIAIKDKNKADYVLGIILDKDTQNDNITFNDQVYVMDMVLKGLKWNIINVYALDYYKSSENLLQNIIEAINNTSQEEKFEINPTIKYDHENKDCYQKKLYSQALCPYKIRYDSVHGFDYQIIDYLNSLISVEGPISFETIKQRVKKAANIEAVSAKMRTKLEHILSDLGFSQTEDQNTTFYWKTNNHLLDAYRYQSGLDLYDISKEELANLMGQIIGLQGKMEKTDLYHLVLEELAYETLTLTERNRNRLDYVYNWALSKMLF